MTSPVFYSVALVGFDSDFFPFLSSSPRYILVIYFASDPDFQKVSLHIVAYPLS
jgi:hypothetical protein